MTMSRGLEIAVADRLLSAKSASCASGPELSTRPCSSHRAQLALNNTATARFFAKKRTKRSYNTYVPRTTVCANHPAAHEGAEGIGATNKRVVSQSAAVLLALGMAVGFPGYLAPPAEAAVVEVIDEDMDFDAEPEQAGNLIVTEANAALLAPAAPTFFETLGAGAFASCTAEACTLPLELVKVRVQIQKRRKSESEPEPEPESAMGSAEPPAAVAAPAEYRGVIGPIKQIAAQEGAAALWRGLSPGLQHHFLSGGVRLALYNPIKAGLVAAYAAVLYPEALVAPSPDEFLTRVAAGLLCGVAAVVTCNPTDVLKVRLQNSTAKASKAMKSDAPTAGHLMLPQLPVFPSPIEALQRVNPFADYAAIVREDGVLTLYKGVGPNAVRGGIIAATELTSYDTLKEWLLHYHSLPVPACVAGAAVGAGLLAGVLIVPVDLVRCRLMAGAEKNPFAVVGDLLSTEGVGALLRGAPASMARVSTFDMITFLLFEAVTNGFVRP